MTLSASPESFSEALFDAYLLSHIGQDACPTAETAARFQDRLAAAAATHHAAIFKRRGGRATIEATYRFFISLQEAGRFPLAWFGLLHRAFRAGEINRLAWGVAARMIYGAGGGGRPGYRGENIPVLTAGFKDASPYGLMLRAERMHYRALPDRLTLYRGAVASGGEEAAQGISWTLSREYAAKHLLRRHMQVSNPFFVGSPVSITPSQRPLLVTAMIDKEATFGWLSNGDDEVLVEPARIPLNTLKVEKVATTNVSASIISGMLINIARLQSVA